MSSARRIVSALVMVGCALALGGCAETPRTQTDLRLESADATAAVFGSVEQTACPGLLACVERANAPLPVVRTVRSSGTSPSSPQEPASPEPTFQEIKRAELEAWLATNPFGELEPIVTELP